MTTVKDRVNLLIEELNISKNQFAKEIGTSSAMISKITTKEINFGIDIAEKIISRYPEVNPTWLLTGIGKMFLASTNKYINGNPDTIGYPKSQDKIIQKEFDSIFNTESIERQVKEKKRVKSYYKRLESDLEKIDPELAIFNHHIESFSMLTEWITDVFEANIETSFQKIILQHELIGSSTTYPNYEAFREIIISELKANEKFSGPLNQLIMSMQKFIKEVSIDNDQPMNSTEEVNSDDK